MGHDHSHEHGGHGYGDPNLAHHFQHMQQQFEAAKLGMWLFLATEVLLFAGLFCAYTVYRFNHPEVFKHASTFLNTPLGATNTVVLLLSSFTAALAVRAAQLRNTPQLKLMLALTILGAVGFLGIKYVEYSHKFHEHTLWGLRFDPRHQAPRVDKRHTHHAAATPAATEHLADASQLGYKAVQPGSDLVQQANVVVPPVMASQAEAKQQQELPDYYDPLKVRNVHIFFGIYFCMTGLHGLHVVIGMIVLLWLLWRANRGDFSNGYYLPVDLGALYWHLVDLIWIFLFPLLYLI
ncbi:MAG: cytochrome c oxidase subunit 3 family protein [Planctomycetota bacterium]